MRLRVHNISGHTFYVADLDRVDAAGNPVQVSPMFGEHRDADFYLRGMVRGAEYAAAKGMEG